MGFISRTSSDPVGTIKKFGLVTVPDGYLTCDGSDQLVASYPELAAALFDSGTGFYMFGSSGAGHFYLPPAGVFYRSVDVSAVNDPDNTTRTAANTNGNTGVNVGSFQTDQFASHHHAPPDGSSFPTTHSGGAAYTGGGEVNTFATTADTGGNQTNPRNVYVNFGIKY